MNDGHLRTLLRLAGRAKADAILQAQQFSDAESLMPPASPNAAVLRNLAEQYRAAAEAINAAEDAGYRYLAKRDADK
jgi:hypothetical protein